MGVAGTGVSEGPSVGGGPGVSGITVLASAVITMGVTRIPPGAVAGGSGAQAARKRTRIVKVSNFFISASFFEDVFLKPTVPRS